MGYDDSIENEWTKRLEKGERKVARGGYELRGFNLQEKMKNKEKGYGRDVNGDQEGHVEKEDEDRGKEGRYNSWTNIAEEGKIKDCGGLHRKRN